jgi:hypothetical protein
LSEVEINVNADYLEPLTLKAKILGNTIAMSKSWQVIDQNSFVLPLFSVNIEENHCYDKWEI